MPGTLAGGEIQGKNEVFYDGEAHNLGSRGWVGGGKP